MAEFELDLEDNIFELYLDLRNNRYQHSSYFNFKIADPKPRTIHKACVRDRVMHQAVFRSINPVFEETFIFDSDASRVGKGVRKSVFRLDSFVQKTSKNFTRPVYAVKIDVCKFFASIDHQILFQLIKERIACSKTLELISNIIESFSMSSNKGIPLGNVTSQLFGNIYLDSLDKFIKYELQEKYYLRFSDDMIIVKEEDNFDTLILAIEKFARTNLNLSLKTEVPRKLKWGFDWLGYVILPHHRILRTRTKNRMFKRINFENVSSYLGLLKHCNSYKLKEKLKLLE